MDDPLDSIFNDGVIFTPRDCGNTGDFHFSPFPPHENKRESDTAGRCNRCCFGGSDVFVRECGCRFHARCLAIRRDALLASCPSCSKPANQLVLLPMRFDETNTSLENPSNLKISARQSQEPKSKRLKTSVTGFESSRDDGFRQDSNTLRTGRWSHEEMELCDRLIVKFEAGELPICDDRKMKLNEFLGKMLRSKQARLTKKMKNAKLSTRVFEVTTGGLVDDNEARDFSSVEDCFLRSIRDNQERSEMRFHMQREWRECFREYCSSIGQNLDAEDWLSSVEEINRRSSRTRRIAQLARRQYMMASALREDSKNFSFGVHIESTEANEQLLQIARGIQKNGHRGEEELLKRFHEVARRRIDAAESGETRKYLNSPPFLAKVISFLEKQSMPFEHVELWVPSFMNADAENASPSDCRICYAGSASACQIVGADGEKTQKVLTAEERFKLESFCNYSQNFSFDVDCGIPGRVYESAIPAWERNIDVVGTASDRRRFERSGGATQWGIRTVLGIPVPSPNVGRVVVLFYSLLDREKDDQLISKLSNELTRLLPSPKWTLVVDVGFDEQSHVEESDEAHCGGEAIKDEDRDAPYKSWSINTARNATTASTESSTNHASPLGKDPRIDDVIALLGEFMPSGPHEMTPQAPYLQGFTSLRVLLLVPPSSRSAKEEELVSTLLDSYSFYSQSGKSRSETSLLLARDFMFLEGHQIASLNSAVPSEKIQCPSPAALYQDEAVFFNINDVVETEGVCVSTKHMLHDTTPSFPSEYRQSPVDVLAVSSRYFQAFQIGNQYADDRRSIVSNGGSSLANNSAGV